MNPSPRENGHQFQLEELLAYLDDVIQSFENHPDETTRRAAFGMLQALDALHRETFRRLIAFLAERDAGHLLAEAADSDRIIHTVLALYDLLPDDEAARARVESALAPVRPYVESHGGTLDILHVSGGTVHLEMGGACHGCPGAQVTLQRGVQRALEEGYPAFEELVLHEPEPQAKPAAGLIALDQIQTAPAYLQAPRFQTVMSLEELSPGSMQQVEAGDAQLLVANVGGEIYALAAFCPGTRLPLAGGELAGGTLACPWHGERFDVRNGRLLEDGGRRQAASLPVYPVAVQDKAIQVAVNVPARPIIAETARGA